MEKEIKSALYRAFYNGNSFAIMAEDDFETIEKDFETWYKDNLDWIKNLTTKAETSESNVILPDVSGWVSVDDKDIPMASHNGKIEIKFEGGDVVDFDDKDCPWDLVTHWRPKP